MAVCNRSVRNPYQHHNEGGKYFMPKKKTAAYKIITDSGGNRYKFYCDLTGALLCTTKSYHADTPERELELAWNTEGKAHFICATSAGNGSSKRCSTQMRWNV